MLPERQPSGRVETLSHHAFGTHAGPLAVHALSADRWHIARHTHVLQQHMVSSTGGQNVKNLNFTWGTRWFKLQIVSLRVELKLDDVWDSLVQEVVLNL